MAVGKKAETIFGRGFEKNTGLSIILSWEIPAITGITIRETGEPATPVRFEMTVPMGSYWKYQDTLDRKEDKP